MYNPIRVEFVPEAWVERAAGQKGANCLDTARYRGAPMCGAPRRANRKAREVAYDSCGLVKVCGALGGVYWE